MPPISPINLTCHVCHEVNNSETISVRQRLVSGYNGNRPVALCETCRDSISFCCYACGDRFVIESANESPNSRLYCNYCFESHFTSCYGCEMTMNRNEVFMLSMDRVLPGLSRVTRADTFFCPNCWHDHTFECRNCGDRRPNNECHTDDNGRDFCTRCYHIKPVLSKTFKNNPYHRTAGFELEYHIEQNISLDLLEYGHLHDDGSIRAPTGRYPQEFASYPTNGDRLLTVITEVCKVLNQNDAEVNTSCGFHVHIHVADLTKEQRENIKNWWRLLEKIFLATVAPSRRSNNQYSKTVEGLHPISRWENDRYVTMNITALSKHGTYEFRLHQGTLNAGKIKSWIQLLLAFIEVYSKVRATPERLTRIKKLSPRGQLIFLFQQLNLSVKLRKFIVSRIKEFGPYIDIKSKKPIFSKRMSKSKRLLLEHFGDPIGKIDLRIVEDEETPTQIISVPPPAPQFQSGRMYFINDPGQLRWNVVTTDNWLSPQEPEEGI